MLFNVATCKSLLKQKHALMHVVQFCMFQDASSIYIYIIKHRLKKASCRSLSQTTAGWRVGNIGAQQGTGRLPYNLTA